MELSDDQIAAQTRAELGRRASANLNGVSGVSPDDALAGIQGAGVAPPSAGMLNAPQTRALTLQQESQAVVGASPSVARWAATAPPAHVALTQDDLPNLAKVGAATGNLSGSLQSLADGLGGAWQGLQHELSSVGPEIFQASKARQDEAGQTVAESLRTLGATGMGPSQAIGAAVNLVSSIPMFLGGSQLAGAADVLVGKGLQTATAGLPSAPNVKVPLLGTVGFDPRLPANVAGDTLLNVGGFLIPGAEGAASHATAQRAPLPERLGGQYKVPDIGVHQGADNLRTAVAHIDAGAAKHIQDLIAEGKTVGRSPQVMQDYLAQHFGDETVAVDPEKLAELAIQGHEPFPNHADAIASAHDFGEDVNIPKSEYLTNTAGKSYDEELNAATTFREGGVSVEGAKDAARVGATTPAKPALTPPEDFTPAETSRARYLAAQSETELDQIVKSNRLNELFADAKSIGMTEDQFTRYSAGIEDALASARERLHNRAYDQIRRERGPQWKEKLAENIALAEQDVAGDPSVRTRAYLEQGKGPLGEPLERPGLKLSSDDQLAQHGKDLGLPDRMFSKSGLPVDEVASILGFDSGADLIHGLSALKEHQGELTIAQHVKGLVRDIAEARTREQLGFNLNPEAIHAEASAAIHDEPITNFLAQEVKGTADLAGLPFDRGRVEARAADHFASKSTRAALNIRQMEGWVYKLGGKAEKALQKGDNGKAFLAKQAQFIQHLNLKEAHGFTKEFNKTDRSLKRVAKRPVSSGMDQTARNQLRGIADWLGYKVRVGKFESVESALRGQSLPQYNDALRRTGLTPDYTPLPPDRVKDIKSLPVDAFRDYSRMVQSISELGRRQMQVVLGEKKALLADTVAQIAEAANTLGRRFTAGELLEARERLLKGVPGKYARALGSVASRVETALFWLDGEKNGPLMQSVVNPIQEGKFTESDRTLAMAQDFSDFVARQPDGWAKGLNRKVNVPELLYSRDRFGNPVRRLRTVGDVISMVTHLGTESNLRKLTEGYGWDEATVRAVADEHLTKADYDYAQFILDQHAKLKPDIDELYRDTAGLAIGEQPAIPIPTKFGEYPGGYRHITYDWDAVGEHNTTDGETVTVHDPNALSGSDLFGNDHQIATPPNSSTIARVESFSAPIQLDHSILHREFESVIHDISYRRALIQAAKVLGHSDVRGAIHDALGPEYNEAIQSWLKDTARKANTDQQQLRLFASLARGFRRRFTTVQIGLNVSTLLKHAGIGIAHINGEVGAGRFARAMSDLYTNPENGKRWQDFVNANSGEVRGAALNIDRDVRELVKDTFRKQGFLSYAQQHAFIMFGKSKQLEAQGTWLAKYRQLTEEVRPEGEPQFLPHADAVALANKSVRDTQGSGAVVDLPALFRGNNTFLGELGKLFSLFTNFENTATNRMWTMIRRAPRAAEGIAQGVRAVGEQGLQGFKDEGWAGGRRDFGKILADSFSYIILPAAYATAFEQATVGGEDNFWDGFSGNVGGNLAKAVLGGSIPGGNILADLPRTITSKGHDPGSDPVMQVLKEAVTTGVDVKRAAAGEHVEDRWVQHAADTVGYILSLPTKPVGKGGQYLWNITHANDGTDPPDFLELIRGLLFGPKRKATTAPAQQKGFD